MVILTVVLVWKARYVQLTVTEDSKDQEIVLYVAKVTDIGPLLKPNVMPSSNQHFVAHCQQFPMYFYGQIRTVLDHKLLLFALINLSKKTMRPFHVFQMVNGH